MFSDDARVAVATLLAKVMNGHVTLEWVVQPEPASRKFILEFEPGPPRAGTALGFARRNVAQ